MHVLHGQRGGERNAASLFGAVKRTEAALTCLKVLISAHIKQNKPFAPALLPAPGSGGSWKEHGALVVVSGTSEPPQGAPVPSGQAGQGAQSPV